MSNFSRKSELFENLFYSKTNKKNQSTTDSSKIYTNSLNTRINSENQPPSTLNSIFLTKDSTNDNQIKDSRKILFESPGFLINYQFVNKKNKSTNYTVNTINGIFQQQKINSKLIKDKTICQEEKLSYSSGTNNNWKVKMPNVPVLDSEKFINFCDYNDNKPDNPEKGNIFFNSLYGYSNYEEKNIDIKSTIKSENSIKENKEQKFKDGVISDISYQYKNKLNEMITEPKTITNPIPTVINYSNSISNISSYNNTTSNQLYKNNEGQKASFKNNKQDTKENVANFYNDMLSNNKNQYLYPPYIKELNEKFADISSAKPLNTNKENQSQASNFLFFNYQKVSQSKSKSKSRAYSNSEQEMIKSSGKKLNNTLGNMQSNTTNLYSYPYFKRLNYSKSKPKEFNSTFTGSGSKYKPVNIISKQKPVTHINQITEYKKIKNQVIIKKDSSQLNKKVNNINKIDYKLNSLIPLKKKEKDQTEKKEKQSDYLNQLNNGLDKKRYNSAGKLTTKRDLDEKNIEEEKDISNSNDFDKNKTYSINDLEEIEKYLSTKITLLLRDKQILENEFNLYWKDDLLNKYETDIFNFENLKLECIEATKKLSKEIAEVRNQIESYESNLLCNR